VSHRRRLLHIPGEYWIVVDDFHGSGQHTFDFHYHFGDGVDPVLVRPRETDLALWAEQAGLFLGIYASQSIASELVAGQSVPIAGWISQGYGNRRPARSLRATLTGSAANSAMTFLVPHSSRPKIQRLNVDAGSAIACIYDHGPFRDVAVFSTGTSEVEVAGFRMQGEFFWLRMEGNVLQQSLAIRGRLLDGKTLEEDALCAPFAAS
jgi:hypothetical protein